LGLFKVEKSIIFLGLSLQDVHFSAFNLLFAICDKHATVSFLDTPLPNFRNIKSIMFLGLSLQVEHLLYFPFFTMHDMLVPNFLNRKIVIFFGVVSPRGKFFCVYHFSATRYLG
jgi:hypothetical protein